MVNLRKREKMPINDPHYYSSSSSDSEDGAPLNKRMKQGSPSKVVTKEMEKTSTVSPSASPSKTSAAVHSEVQESSPSIEIVKVSLSKKRQFIPEKRCTRAAKGKESTVGKIKETDEPKRKRKKAKVSFQDECVAEEVPVEVQEQLEAHVQVADKVQDEDHEPLKASVEEKSDKVEAVAQEPLEALVEADKKVQDEDDEQLEAPAEVQGEFEATVEPPAEIQEEFEATVEPPAEVQQEFEAIVNETTKAPAVVDFKEPLAAPVEETTEAPVVEKVQATVSEVTEALVRRSSRFAPQKGAQKTKVRQAKPLKGSTDIVSEAGCIDVVTDKTGYIIGMKMVQENKKLISEKDEARVVAESHVKDSEHVKKAAKGKGVLQDTPTFSTQVSQGFEEFINPNLIEVMKEHDRTDSQDSEFEDTQPMYTEIETKSDDDFQDPPPKEFRKQDFRIQTRHGKQLVGSAFDPHSIEAYRWVQKLQITYEELLKVEIPSFGLLDPLIWPLAHYICCNNMRMLGNLVAQSGKYYLTRSQAQDFRTDYCLSEEILDIQIDYLNKEA